MATKAKGKVTYGDGTADVYEKTKFGTAITWDLRLGGTLDQPRTDALPLRELLSQGTGMLFLFGGPTTSSFWMKATSTGGESRWVGMRS